MKGVKHALVNGEKKNGFPLHEQMASWVRLYRTSRKRKKTRIDEEIRNRIDEGGGGCVGVEVWHGCA